MLRAIVVATLVSSTAMHAAERVVFSTPAPIVATDAHQLTGGDFDRDGRGDLLFVEFRKSITVMRGRGDGTFAPVKTPLASYGELFAAADLNGDGNVDLVMEGEASILDVVVFLGRGDGTFAQASSLRLSEQSTIALGRFTSDGNVDLVAVTRDDLTVFPGDGQGRFGSAIRTAVGGVGRDMAVADANNDGRDDVLGSDGNVFLSLGDGRFQRTGTFSGFGWLIETIDVNGDGRVDRLIAELRANFFKLSLGNGDGTFQAERSYATTIEVADLAAGDLNGDGLADVVAADGFTHVTVYLGRADGTLPGPSIYVAPMGASEIVVGEYTGDGRMDVLVRGDVATLLPGNGDGTLRAPRAFRLRTESATTGGNGSTAPLDLADVTGDGRPDVVTMTRPLSPSISGADITVLPGLGGGAFGAPVHTSVSGDVRAHAVGDFDGDGRIDVVAAAESSRLLFFAGRGDGTFTQAVESAAVAGAFALTAADFTHDGRLDLLLAGYEQFFAYVGDGRGRFTSAGGPPVHFDSGAKVIVADMNRDQVPDVVANGAVFLSFGTGRFSRVTDTAANSISMPAAAATDLDRDGHIDLVLQFFDDALLLRRGRGDGRLERQTRFALTFRSLIPDEPLPSATADFNGDGNMDVALGTSVLLGDGRGAFGGLEQIRYRGLHADVAAADLDGNGWADLVTLDNGIVDVYLAGLEESRELPVTLTVDTLAASIPYGSGVTLSAQARRGSAAYELFGAVRFSAGDRNLGIAVLDESGRGSIVVYPDTGSYTVTGTFLRNNVWGETATSLQQTVTRAATMLHITAEPGPSAPGQPVTIRWFFGFLGTQAAPPTGTVAVAAGATTLATVDVSAPSFTTSALPAGTHTITVSYSGDANYQPVTATHHQVVRERGVTMTLTATPPPPVTGPATLTARLDPAAATGRVTFYDGERTVGTASVSSGVATISVLLFPGTHVIRAVYSGDATFGGAVAEVAVWVGEGPPRRRSARH